MDSQPAPPPPPPIDIPPPDAPNTFNAGMTPAPGHGKKPPPNINSDTEPANTLHAGMTRELSRHGGVHNCLHTLTLLACEAAHKTKKDPEPWGSS